MLDYVHFAKNMNGRLLTLKGKMIGASIINIYIYIYFTTYQVIRLLHCFSQPSE